VLDWIERARLLVWKTSLPNLVIGATAAALVCGGGAVLWLATGQADQLPLFFRSPGTLIIVALNLAGLGLSLLARRQFSRGEPMRLVWSVLALAAACSLTSGVFSQVDGENWRRARLILGGPVQTVLLALGLALALRIYRQSGIRSRPRIPDWLLMGVVAGFCGWEVSESLLRPPGSVLGFQQAASLVNDPLLSLLLIEAILIRRAALKMGRGLIARCWGAFTAGIFLTFVGDIAVWLSGHSPLPVPLTATTWYLWFLASGAYTLAPACQVEACRLAGGSLPDR